MPSFAKSFRPLATALGVLLSSAAVAHPVTFVAEGTLPTDTRSECATLSGEDYRVSITYDSVRPPAQGGFVQWGDVGIAEGSNLGATWRVEIGGVERTFMDTVYQQRWQVRNDVPGDQMFFEATTGPCVDVCTVFVEGDGGDNAAWRTTEFDRPIDAVTWWPADPADLGDGFPRFQRATISALPSSGSGTVGCTLTDWTAAFSVGPADSDGDGVTDDLDLCEGYADDEDDDGDGVPDGCDLCDGDDASGDTDLDSTCDAADNCPVDANAGQADADGDGLGDACETDADADAVIDDDDNCVDDFNPDQADNDGDGLGDVCDDDDDDDDVPDDDDVCPLVADDQTDADGDGQGDACDGDDDGDGVDDLVDLCPGTPVSVPYNDDGCSGAQWVDHVCDPTRTWDTRGAYVSCVAHATNGVVSDGLLTSSEGAALKRGAARR